MLIKILIKNLAEPNNEYIIWDNDDFYFNLLSLDNKLFN